MTAPLALVTGGSRGIGRAVCLELARRGHDIAFCYRTNPAAADEVVSEIIGMGRQAHAAVCDVADAANVTEWVKTVQSQTAPIDVLVNCAGITRDAPLVTMSPAHWDEVIQTNLSSMFHVCRCVAFSMLKRRRGVIVNVSSVSGIYGNAGQANYAAAKAGIIGFSRSLAKEMARYQVRVNVVAPGLIDTDMVRKLSDNARHDITARIPMGRLGHADEVARTVAYLVSEDASYITNQVLGVDGGLVL